MDSGILRGSMMPWLTMLTGLANAQLGAKTAERCRIKYPYSINEM